MLKSKSFKSVWSVVLSLIFILSATGLLSAKEKGRKTEDQRSVAIPFTFGEIVYSVNILQRIQIQGDEVVPFLAVFNSLTKQVAKANEKKKKRNDVISVKMPIAAVSNFAIFMQRATLTGSEAVQFEAVVKKAMKSVRKKK